MRAMTKTINIKGKVCKEEPHARGPVDRRGNPMCTCQMGHRNIFPLGKEYIVTPYCTGLLEATLMDRIEFYGVSVYEWFPL